MLITVGGTMIVSGIMVSLITLAGTAAGIYAASQSDRPDLAFSWKWPIAGAVLAAILILVGRFSGL